LRLIKFLAIRLDKLIRFNGKTINRDSFKAMKNFRVEPRTVSPSKSIRLIWTTEAQKAISLKQIRKFV
jgi:hypothetical protein